ncbi:hypothetical protein CLV92_10174 [Kineococcus xinjiangensis]|uniref:Uncharacterized protein n=1 Tax=Kineococcus xinjiangensis TaxID=512762 RepID=A0A2S6IVI7_9ACTN|nr:hypothetical protein [Kineococcus xinjiangensis]PPK98379.1 hypothetical protein CLV92_10174 [Kineococcus xinjiangensis]
MSLPQTTPVPEAAATARPSHFQQEIEDRAQRARASIERATAEGEDYLAEVHLAELESLVRLASENDVDLPAARDYLRAQRVIDLTALEERAAAPSCGA